MLQNCYDILTKGVFYFWQEKRHEARSTAVLSVHMLWDAEE